MGKRLGERNAKKEKINEEKETERILMSKMRRLSGWGVRGRPFSPKEFNRSWLKYRKSEKTYHGYLESLAFVVKEMGVAKAFA